MRVSLTILFALLRATAALDNGVGLTPPMGWRSWNAFGIQVDQQTMVETMDAAVRPHNSSDPTSLASLGYTQTS